MAGGVPNSMFLDAPIVQGPAGFFLAPTAVPPRLRPLAPISRVASVLPSSRRPAPRGDQATKKLVRRHPLLCGQGGELAMARGRELFAGPILHDGRPTQDLAVETEPVGVLSHDL